MKKLSLVLVLAILLGGGAIGAMSAPADAQGYQSYNYPPPPQDPSATPWVGPNTPWVYYNNDWFLNGMLYYHFGSKYGWAPYYAYSSNYVVRHNSWYGHRWNSWYQGHPNYWNNFRSTYPYWRDHRHGHYYNQNFYNQHHRGQGGGWHKGFHGEGHRGEGHHGEDRHGGGRHGGGRHDDDHDRHHGGGRH